MLSHLQIFVIASLLVVVGLSTAGGMHIHSVAQEHVVQLQEDSNNSIAQGYINTVWKKYREVIVPLSGDPAHLQVNAQVAQFAQDTIHYFQQMPLVRVNIYSGNSLLLISDNITQTSQIVGSGASPDKDFIISHLRAGAFTSSQLLADVSMRNENHAKLVQTLSLIRLPGGGAAPEGGIEILTDITDTANGIQTFQTLLTLGIIGAFIVFLLVLSINSRQTESIIAKQHEANIELMQTAATALAENRDKSQFLTNISHELRTPLNAIIGFSEIIKAELLPKLQERKYDQYVNDINSAGIHLLSLINDILDYSKAEAGKLAMEVTEVDVTKMVQNSMRLVGPRAEAGSIKLVEEMPKEHIIMIIDGKKFKQVLLNLLSNAVKFTPAGGFVAVTAWVNIVDDTVTFEVKDSGIGIAPKDISRAMSPFGQVDNTLKRKFEGTGLGLPLTKKFVELMGGKFTIESEVGKGTKVIFTLPRETTERDGVMVKQAS